MDKMDKGRFSGTIVQFRWVIIIGFIAITAFFARQLPKLEIDPEIKRFLPQDLPSRVSTDKIEEIFGGTEMLMVLFKTDDVLNPNTLLRVKKIAKKIHRVKGVDKVLSLFDLKSIKGEDGAMIVNPVVKRIPKTDEAREKLRKEIKNNDLVYGSVVSEDFKLTTVIAILKTTGEDARLVEELQEIINEHPGDEQVMLGGLPYIRSQIMSNIRNDFRKLLPFGLIIMLAFLYFCFKQVRGVVLPFIVVIMSIIVAMGMLPLIGWKVQVITIMMPIILVAVANDYGIHLIARYQELVSFPEEFSKRELAQLIFSSLSRPVILTGITTAVGMLCLYGHVMVPARRLGLLTAIGVVFALSASLLFIPALISFMPRRAPKAPTSHNGSEAGKALFDRMLLFFSKFVSTRPRLVIIVSVLFSLIASIGIFFVTIDADPVGYFPEKSPIVVASRSIDKHFGGSQNVSVVFAGDIKDPGIMKKINTMEKDIEAMEAIGLTSSIARVVRMMSRALNDSGEQMYDRIPDTRNAVAQYFELYAMSGDAEDFEKLVDFPYEHAVISARINSTSTPVLNRAVNDIRNKVKDDPTIKYIGGFGLIFSDLARLIINGQFLSLTMATIAVSILLMLLFRSIAAGFFSAIPLVFSMMVLFGLMGIFSIELNVATAMLSSIMIGVGIDYTIHFLWRYREERRHHDAATAIRTTLTTTGRGIIFNALSVVVGFTMLLFSNFMPIKFFGFLVVVSISACLFGAMILVPALCLVIKPKFLEPKGKKV